MLLLGAGVGGYIYINKIITRFDRNWEKSASKDFVAEVRKKEQHFDNSIRTSNSTCANMAPKIIDILDQLLDPQDILQQLSRSPMDTSLWKELSVMILTRAASEVYCLSLFVCYLRIQLLVIAGYLYVDSVSNSSATPPSTAGPSMNQSIQLKYLSLLHAFYDEGIKEIVAPVREAVMQTLDQAGLKLNDRLSYRDLKNVFDEVCHSIS